jgi:hypothetical protein
VASGRAAARSFYIPIVDIEASQLFDAVPGRGRESAGF